MREPAPANRSSCSWPLRDADHLLVNGVQMAALEQQLFASGLPVEALMEKAALAVCAALRRDWAPRLARSGALVLVGPGHNGGDGLVIARELHLASIAVAIWSPFDRHKPLTAAHLSHARWLGIPLLQDPPDPAGAALWIDALFGIGQRRAPSASLSALLEARAQHQPDGLVALDVPSGLDDSSGMPLGAAAAKAATTYTIGLIKQGLVQDVALGSVGRLQRIDLGLPAAQLLGLEAATPLGLMASDAGAGRSPWPPLPAAASKYERGRLLLIAGSAAFPGAGHLALLGASASGLGSLRCAVPPLLARNLWQVLPHAVLHTELACNPDGALLLGGLQQSPLTRLDAVLLGPGIGSLDADGLSAAQLAAEQQAWEQLQQFKGLLLLDADGLNRATPNWLRKRSGPTWITPHRGEFDRLWPALETLPPLQAAGRAAADCGAVVLLKGARSVVAAPDGRCWQLLDACPAAARAGLGDVLAGYASGRGAMAIAHGNHCEPCWLAAAALDHALAGQEAHRRGATTFPPAAVAQWLERRPWSRCSDQTSVDADNSDIA